MSKDEIGKYRSKSRFIFELRYDPILGAFDKRGLILETINSLFKKKIGHWKVENIAVHFANDFTTPTKQISIDHLKSLIIYEDPDSLEEFYNDADRLLKALVKIFPNDIKIITRIGMRFINIFEFPGYNNFTEVHKKIKETYLIQDLPLSLNIKDCRIVLEHETGTINIGPAKENEKWTQQMFADNNNKIPKFGFGIDIDSYAKDIECPQKSDLFNALRTTFDLTIATENEIAKSFLGK